MEESGNTTVDDSPSGRVQERYVHSVYGVPILPPLSFAVRSAWLFACETLYAGYRWDTAKGMFAV
ncbi:hypothetical protein D6833_03805 [Candidatus Parcubacteria bacterium]|nr:MAG: hypothetical protein D6833_03805 [Candidatus Parcubacteria bacterium]